MNREAVKNLLKQFICMRPTNGIEAHLEKLLDDLQTECLKAQMPAYTFIARIGVCVIHEAHDTVWITPHETLIEAIFKFLALDLDSREGEPEKQLNDFITMKDQHLWQEKQAEAKSKEPVQLELNLKN